MTRHSGVGFQHNFPATGSGQAENIREQLLADIATVMLSNEADPDWEVFDSLSGVNDVLRSKGDRSIDGGNGDVNLYIQLISGAGVLDLYTYSDWSTVSSTGRNKSATSSLYYRHTISDTAETDVWFWINNYLISGIIGWSGNYMNFCIGSPQKRSITGRSGSFFSDAIASAGSEVEISCTRDMRGLILPGQQIWGIDQTPDGDALLADHVEVLTVDTASDAVGEDYVRVDSIASDFAAGAWFGLDLNCGHTSGNYQDRFSHALRGDGQIGANSPSFMYYMRAVNANNNYGIPVFTDVKLEDNYADRGVLDDTVVTKDSTGVLSAEEVWYPNNNGSMGFVFQDDRGPAANYYYLLRQGAP